MPEIRLCGAAEIPIGKAKAFEIKGRKIALFHRPSGFFAIDDHCPHRGGPLSEGPIDNEEVLCPWHQWAFRLSDGTCSNIPGSFTETFPVTLKQESVWVTI